MFIAVMWVSIGLNPRCTVIVENDTTEDTCQKKFPSGPTVCIFAPQKDVVPGCRGAESETADSGTFIRSCQRKLT